MQIDYEKMHEAMEAIMMDRPKGDAIESLTFVGAYVMLLHTLRNNRCTHIPEWGAMASDIEEKMISLHLSIEPYMPWVTSGVGYIDV